MIERLCISTNNLTESGKIGIIGAQENKKQNKTKKQKTNQINRQQNNDSARKENKMT